MAYSDDYSRSDVPDAVRTYIRDFQNAIESQNISAILQYYETDWNKMTERYFKSTPWPHWRTVENLVGQDAVFILFYKGKFSSEIHGPIDALDGELSEFHFSLIFSM